jgi:hypothetical protein
VTAVTPSPSDDDGGMHVVIATFEDGHTERIRCPCAGCELWRTVDFRAMREQYERSLDEWVLGYQEVRQDWLGP